MGVFDGFLNMMQLATDDDDDDEDFNRGYEDEEPAKKQKIAQRREPDAVRTVADKRAPEPRNSAPSKPVASSRVTPVRTSPVAKRVNNPGQIAVCIMQPKSYDDGRDVSDLLKEGNPVFLNLEGVEYELAQRIIDFVSGSCFALEGSLQRISNCNFLFSPKNVPINGINIDMMDTFEFNGIRSDF